ncbi:hypothetical protein Q8A67_019622 [Cirrhinus molitorella]|uniref:Uncharacterized protein n=1 Tax=Cirrhinus molitorella TaxID=172907 RepID=A0AA88TGI6_9TELE|nr:hypothetical protein Q8A67_019622 [Cirrhinus molitorella]
MTPGKSAEVLAGDDEGRPRRLGRRVTVRGVPRPRDGAWGARERSGPGAGEETRGEYISRWFDSHKEQVSTARRNISQTRQLTIIMDLKQHLQKLECHFTWDLGQYRNELQGLRRNIQDILEQGCNRLVHHYNLLSYIQQTLGSDTEALDYLKKAESVMQEQGTEEAAVRLQVNKANLAWVYFLMGDMDKSKAYLEGVKRLQRMHPAPPKCTLHPEVSAEKGWTLMKFNKTKKYQAIDYFKMALKAEPERNEWHKEALRYLREAESVMQEQGTEEAGVWLQVNKANLAWTYFLMGEIDKSKGYLEEVERLQGMHPAPPEFTLHPEVSGEKSLTLVKFS